MLKYLTNKTWWKNAIERAIKTFLQTFVAMAGITYLMSLKDLITMVLTALASSATAAVLSLLTSLADAPNIVGSNEE